MMQMFVHVVIMHHTELMLGSVEVTLSLDAANVSSTSFSVTSDSFYEPIIHLLPDTHKFEMYLHKYQKQSLLLLQVSSCY